MKKNHSAIFHSFVSDLGLPNKAHSRNDVIFAPTSIDMTSSRTITRLLFRRISECIFNDHFVSSNRVRAITRFDYVNLLVTFRPTRRPVWISTTIHNVSRRDFGKVTSTWMFYCFKGEKQRRRLVTCCKRSTRSEYQSAYLRQRYDSLVFHVPPNAQTTATLRSICFT